MQKFKSIYFADFPASETKRRNLKLAFGDTDQDLFGVVRTLSSADIRSLLGRGSYGDLQDSAKTAGASLNAYCIDLLRKNLAYSDLEKQLALDLIETHHDRFIDPIHTTFRGGKAEPLQSWYPYLEGYSPDFVSTIIESYAPNAKRVLDPFAGTGTTPLTIANAGLESFYCELNPLLQFLVEAKSSAVCLEASERKRLSGAMRELASSLPKAIYECKPDQRLAIAYERVFRKSKFFPEKTFQDCLKLRALLDIVNCLDPKLALLATVASISALIPCSNLIRRGDLRFRKGSESAAIVDNLAAEVSKNLLAIASDIEGLKPHLNRPLLIAGDAKRLDRIARMEIDAVVTSPPYLNGTNYYRNTKIELWFLRALTSARDLTNLRQQTVTAGINDVTGQRSEPISKSVGVLIESLEAHSYDRRIPHMVSDYFADMKQVFKGLQRHMKPGSPLIIDIGDSAYAGVWVDTPKILSEILHEEGWDVTNEVPLRHRMSRGGQPLRQVLIAGVAPSIVKSSYTVKNKWRSKWTNFKKELPHQNDDFAKRNWGSPLHSLCSFQGKMKPSLAHHLVKSFLKPGDRMLDPFGGVGTIPFEAAQHGVSSWNFDISPAALPIATAKLVPATRAECDQIMFELDSYIKQYRVKKVERIQAETVRFNGSLPDYFHPRTFNEILLARRYFSENPPVSGASSLVFSSLLHILHGNRPYALSRRSHPITPFAPSGEAEYKKLVNKLREKLDRSLAVERSGKFVSGMSIMQDATSSWPQAIDELDAIITSPPFFDSTRFYLANWMRLWFAGWSSDDFKERPKSFVDERQKKDFSVYQSIIRQARERLKLGGVCVFHLGKSRKCDMAVEVARISRPWFKNSEIFTESVEHCESHGIRDKGTVVEHTYLVLS